MAKFRKKPVVIEAVQFTGKNFNEVDEFTGKQFRASGTEGKEMVIQTLEGAMTASLNDFIIKGENGEFYPCKPDVFEKTYEPVSE